MIGKINKKDTELLEWLRQLRILTVSQLSALTGRSRQVIRRRIRYFVEQEIFLTWMQPYGEKRGRPEEIISLTENGWNMVMKNQDSKRTNDWSSNKSLDWVSLKHEILVNWVLIHLIKVGNEIDQLSINYLTRHICLIDPKVGETVGWQDQAPMNRINDSFEFVPDGVLMISNSKIGRALLFFLEVDMGTEPLTRKKESSNDIRQKILNYQKWFLSGQYKAFENVFQVEFNGFRLLFISNSDNRINTLSRFTQQMPPSDFIWLTDQDRMFKHGLSSKIWIRGGHIQNPRQSILGERLACDIMVMDKIRK